jgi:hypothetical protein
MIISRHRTGFGLVRDHVKAREIVSTWSSFLTFGNASSSAISWSSHGCESLSAVVDEVRHHQGLPASLPKAASKARPLSSCENPSSPFSSHMYPLIGLCAKAWLMLSI